MSIVQDLTSAPVESLLTLKPDDIYDALMQEIEPDLVSAQQATLKVKYADETPEAKAERAARYEAAFTEYDKRYEAFEQELQTKVRMYQKSAMQTVEQNTKDREQDDLTAIESSLAA